MAGGFAIPATARLWFKMPRMRLFSSIRRRLALLIIGVAVVVVAVFGVVSFREVRNSAVLAAGDRLEKVSRELASLLSAQGRQLRVPVKALSEDTAVRAFLHAPGAKTHDAALAKLQRVGTPTSNVAALELWDTSGRRLVTTHDAWQPLPDQETRNVTAQAAREATVVMGPLVAAGDSLHYTLATKVSEGQSPLGYVVERRAMATSAAGAQQLRELVGSDAGLLVGNVRGDVWTDFVRRVPPPPVAVQGVQGLAEYERAQSGPQLAWVTTIADTPWALVVEFPRSTVLAGTRAVLWRMAGFAVLILVLAALAGWALSGSLTRPLSELARAANDISAGDYARRVVVTTKDELGTVAFAFNRMADSITAARGVLENQITRVAESEARLTRVIGASAAVIYDLRVANGVMVLDWISENVAMVLGYSWAEAHAPGWWLSNVHPDDLEKLGRTAAPETYAEGSNEYRFRTRDGAFRWLREEQRLIYGDDGQPVEVVGAWLDITDQRDLEEQFRHAQKMEAVGRIAGGVAHDFNNLLTVIRSYSDLVLLEISPNDPKREEMLEIRGAADRASVLARQLLAFSRKQVLLPQVFDLNAMVQSFDAMLSRTISTDVEHVTRLARSLGVIKADPGQVEQVLMNLAINAADAMPDGGELTIETANAMLDADYARHHAGVSPGEYVMIAVADTGIGMDRATLDHIFEPFFTTKAYGKGTGLGLSTVYGIVKQNGGHIWVYSEPGHGTTFKVYFPRVYEEVSVPRGLLEGVRPAKVVKPTETVLVVEDEVAVRATVSRILKRQGYTVLLAGHGGEAMRIAAEHQGDIDLVISDLMMPEMSGREFVERFSSARPATRVLFMSGYTDDDAMQRGLVDEHRAFIEKPFTVDQMTRKVREVLDAV
jgi:PAS domain S-box-containing protein